MNWFFLSSIQWNRGLASPQFAWLVSSFLLPAQSYLRGQPGTRMILEAADWRYKLWIHFRTPFLIPENNKKCPREQKQHNRSQCSHLNRYLSRKKLRSPRQFTSIREWGLFPPRQTKRNETKEGKNGGTLNIILNKLFHLNLMGLFLFPIRSSRRLNREEFPEIKSVAARCVDVTRNDYYMRHAETFFKRSIMKQ